MVLIIPNPVLGIGIVHENSTSVEASNYFRGDNIKLGKGYSNLYEIMLESSGESPDILIGSRCSSEESNC